MDHGNWTKNLIEMGVIDPEAEAGADATIRDRVMKWTPLQYASFSNSLEIVEPLLVRGADPADLSDLIERARAENAEIDEKKSAMLNRLLQVRVPARPAFFSVSPQFLDPALLGLTEDLVNNPNDCFNNAPYICTLDVSKPLLLPLPRAVFKGYKNLAKILVESGVGDPMLFSVSTLHLAAYYGRKDIMRMLLYHGMPCDLCKHDGRTPLHVACQRGNVEVGNVLLKRGAEVNARDVNWRTPAMLAAGSGADVLLQELLQKNEETVHVRDQLGRTALYYAAQENHVRCVNILLNAGAVVYVPDKFESSAMQAAMARGHLDAVRAMYPFAEPTTVQDVHKSTPLHYAVAYEYVDIVVSLLVKRHPVNLADRDGVTPLHIAAKRANLKLVNMLLSKEADANLMDSNKLNCLHYAVLGGNEQIVRKFLKMGVRDSPDDPRNLEMCVIMAVKCGHVPILRALLEYGVVNSSKSQLLDLSTFSQNPEMTRTLLELGLNPNAQYSSVEYPTLHLAITEGTAEIASVLLENGADANSLSCMGLSPLHVAVNFNYVNLIKLLLSHGANPNILDKNYKTPAHTAAQEGNLEALKELMNAPDCVLDVPEQPLTVLHFATSSNRIDVIDYLLDCGASVNIVDKNELPLFNYACLSRSNVNTIRHLIDKGANTMCVDSVNRNALHHASMSGKSSVVELLISLGLDINSTDDMHCTPLHIAAKTGVKSCVECLLKNGADMNMKDIRGHVPLQYAFRAKKKETIYTFLKFGANPYSVLYCKSGKSIRHAFTDANHPIFQWDEIIELASKLPKYALRSKYLTLMSPKKCLTRKVKSHKIARVAQLLPEELLVPVEHLTTHVDSGKINHALLKTRKMQNPLLQAWQKTPIVETCPGMSTGTTGSTPRRTPPEVTPRVILSNDTPTITPPPISPIKLSTDTPSGNKPALAARNEKLEQSPAKRTKTSVGEESCSSDTPKDSTTCVKSTSPVPLQAISQPISASPPNVPQKPSKRPKSCKKKRSTRTESTSKNSAKVSVQTNEDSNKNKVNKVNGIQNVSVENIAKPNVSISIMKCLPKNCKELKDSNESLTKSEMSCKESTKLEVSAMTDEVVIDKETPNVSKDVSKQNALNSLPKTFREEIAPVSPAVTTKSSLANICSKESEENVLNGSEDTPEDFSMSVKSTSSISPVLVQAILPSSHSPQKPSKQSKSRKKKRSTASSNENELKGVQNFSVENIANPNVLMLVTKRLRKSSEELKDSDESVSKSEMTCEESTKAKIPAIYDEILIPKKSSNILKDLTGNISLNSPQKASQENMKSSSEMTPKSSPAIVGSKKSKNNILKDESISMAKSLANAPKLLPDNVLHELQIRYAEKFASLVSKNKMTGASQMCTKEIAEIITHYYKEDSSPQQQPLLETTPKKNRWKDRKATSSTSNASLPRPSKSVSVQNSLIEPTEVTAKDMLDVTKGIIESTETAQTPILPRPSSMKSPNLEIKSKEK